MLISINILIYRINMYLSKYFHTNVEHTSKDIKTISHKLSIQAGLIRQISSGLYSWMPMGLRILKKIQNIINEEMQEIDCSEVLMPMIQSADLWRESDRYDAYGPEMLRMKDRHGKEMLFGPTHEEVATDMFRGIARSLKDLPTHFYQIQWKFRDEIRPRHGVMRAREFLMKDGYSFDENKEKAKETYKKVFNAYVKIFKRIGIIAIPTRADSGAIGGDLSHEFQIISKSGENKIFAEMPLEKLQKLENFDDFSQTYVASDDYHKGTSKDYFEYNGIEIGHLFYFGTKYSESMKASVQGQNGEFFPHMGSYGIGVSRLIGAIIESSSDENGIIWPESVAPFKFLILNLKFNDEGCTRAVSEICDFLPKNDVLIDDLSQSFDLKIKNAKKIGIPWIILIGNDFLKTGKILVHQRKNGEEFLLDLNEFKTCEKFKY